MKTFLFALIAAVAIGSAAVQAREGRPGGVLRDRLVAELQMNRSQIARLDAAFAKAQPRLERLRDLSGDERKFERRRVLAELNGRLLAIVTPAQRALYEEIVRDAASDGTAALVRQMR